ncbi:MAG TPA: AmmeMemoRadiSam system radical SAM enzyme [Candidatus Krumholzibacteriaceae bacterium]|nr:AmmeMemoRadiSam system radical SAM enzyme [Candidatus Krumholzibacteriaceae bacterium]
MDKKEALYYSKSEGNIVRCHLCPHECVIREGNRGRCRVRENTGGELFTLSYGRTVTVNLDPIEKKPLFHFIPSSRILSIGPNGCTFTCKNCQNWNISQEEMPTRYISPRELIDLAEEESSAGVAFTYTEPLIWYEYLLDVLPLLKEEGLKSVVITNGFINEEPALELAGMVDGFNIDLKSFNNDFYRKYCGGEVEYVKNFIEIASSVSHVEVTNLLIPGLNDSPEETEAMCRWLSEVSREIPIHFSRFFPHYRMNDRPPTSAETLQKAYEIGRRYLDYVYIGNIFINGTENTYCPECGTVVVERSGFSADNHLDSGCCPSCGREIKGVWS